MTTHPSCGPYSSSIRYGGAPNDALRSTFIDGAALAPASKLATSAAFVANIVAMCESRYHLIECVTGVFFNQKLHGGLGG